MRNFYVKAICVLFQFFLSQICQAAESNQSNRYTEYTPLMRHISRGHEIIQVERDEPCAHGQYCVLGHYEFIQDLPLELWQMVIYQMDMREGQQLALVCRRTYQAYMGLSLAKILKEVEDPLRPLFKMIELHPDLFDKDLPKNFWTPRLIQEKIREINACLKNFGQDDFELYLETSAKKIKDRLEEIEDEKQYERKGPRDEAVILLALEEKMALKEELTDFTEFVHQWSFDHAPLEVQEQLRNLEKFTMIS